MSQATDLHTKMLPAYQIDIAAAPIKKKGSEDEAMWGQYENFEFIFSCHQ